MTSPLPLLRRDALEIWHAGVDAVRADRLVAQQLRVDGPHLWIAGDALPLRDIRRLVVVGAGKAGAGMAAGVEAALGEEVARDKQLAGWLNVPADCVRPLRHLTLHAARPAGLNEPTEDGVAGTRRILELVESLGPDDVCLCLISGGGSALLPAPLDGITLVDKQRVTQHLSANGANIQQLNTVRKRLSRLKGGGLARACRAGRLCTLIISDVLGDPLDIIASGPTVPDPGTAADALQVLDDFRAREAGISARVFEVLAEQQRGPSVDPQGRGNAASWVTASGCHVRNVVIGNNEVAVQAAAAEARRLGYPVTSHAAQHLEGQAEDLGRDLARIAIGLRKAGGRAAYVSGGEPVVRLAPAERRGKGGRNQQLVLAALDHFERAQAGTAMVDPLDRIVLLSGGTDGEDGPTDAAGAVVDREVAAAARGRGLDPADFLARNDAYHFFAPLDALIRTGATHTNVCDLRVVVVEHAGGSE